MNIINTKECEEMEVNSSLNASANDPSELRPTSSQGTSARPRRAKAGNRLPALLQAVREDASPVNSVADPEECEGGGFKACEGNELTEEDPVLTGEKSSAVTEVAKDTSPQDKVNFPPVRGMNNPLVCCLCNKGLVMRLLSLVVMSSAQTMGMQRVPDIPREVLVESHLSAAQHAKCFLSLLTLQYLSRKSMPTLSPRRRVD